MGRRLLWVGLVLVAALVVFLGLIYLTATERVALLTGGLALTAAVSLVLWSDPERVNLSRGLLGLAVFEAVVLLALSRQFVSIPTQTFLVVHVPLAVAGVALGVYEDSTWLATPSAVAFYLGFPLSGMALEHSFLVAVLGVSAGVALAVALVVWGWSTGRLQRSREAYLRRRASLGQLARGHLVLFDLYVLFALSQVMGRSGLPEPVVLPVALLAPFLIALGAVLYARTTGDAKLLNVASLLLAAVAWFSLLLSPRRGFALPLAVAVTAAVLIYLGLRTRRPGTSEG